MVNDTIGFMDVICNKLRSTTSHKPPPPWRFLKRRNSIDGVWFAAAVRACLPAGEASGSVHTVRNEASTARRKATSMLPRSRRLRAAWAAVTRRAATPTSEASVARPVPSPSSATVPIAAGAIATYDEEPSDAFDRGAAAVVTIAVTVAITAAEHEA